MKKAKVKYIKVKKVEFIKLKADLEYASRNHKRYETAYDEQVEKLNKIEEENKIRGYRTEAVDNAIIQTLKEEVRALRLLLGAFNKVNPFLEMEKLDVENIKRERKMRGF